ncbi:hypothetical protein Pint_04188 [Pistacia integerrima]|uniref:Uncharacterized protein n=1 Tax=Pistacia integerrima TaxID=434235 RepID=A0ACC0Z776_9ROSI|nr:hypothetical protein Pint_04188 [Pistacia integerrima]
MGDLQVVGGIKKLNNKNYNTWATCMESYLQGHDLWEVVGGDEVTQPVVEDANGILQSGKLKQGKAMFALKTTIEEEMVRKKRYTSKSRGAFKRYNGSGSKKHGDKGKIPQGKGGSRLGGASKNRGNSRKFDVLRRIKNDWDVEAIFAYGGRRISPYDNNTRKD